MYKNRTGPKAKSSHIGAVRSPRFRSLGYVDLVGFCVVCFAAVAAYHAVETLGCTRVAMLDFDVHHGNGVAASVKNDERVSQSNRRS